MKSRNCILIILLVFECCYWIYKFKGKLLLLTNLYLPEIKFPVGEWKPIIDVSLKFNSTKSKLQRVHAPTQIPYIALVVSSAATHVTRMVPILRTWGRHRKGFHLVVVTDQTLPGEVHGHVFNFTDTYDDAQRRWPLGLMRLLTLMLNETSVLNDVPWVFVLDDDAFLDHRHVQRLLRSINPRRPAIYGQLCPSGQFCGGAGWLAHRTVLQRLLPSAAAACGGGGEPYDLCFSNVLPYVRIEMIERGEFCSQPPAFYAPVDTGGRILDKEDAGLRAGMDYAVTFHYIVGMYDELQQRIDHDKPLWPW